VGAATGGPGGTGSDGAEAGDGGQAHLVDAVDGETSGDLELLQRARGGRAGESLGGLGGAASSHLRRSKSAASLTLRSEALGGGRSILFQAGTEIPSASGPGAPARAISRGDGQPVRVGTELVEDTPGTIVIRSNGVFGESGTSFGIARTLGGGFVEAAATPNVPGGDGGDAESFSLGIAHGRSPVEVHDAAAGGSGGVQLAEPVPSERSPSLLSIPDVGAGRGGAARSIAMGFGGRGEPVLSTPIP
jgi:hypothetical protein